MEQHHTDLRAQTELIEDGSATPVVDREEAGHPLGRLFRILSAEPALSGAVHRKAEGLPCTGRTR
ncbi:hypothetical protein ACFQ8S_07940, partial [Streptomyces virginiae]|uniref:hypothetical protein n=1 Tax=Streptomyces virginiae TaxID=1961 RepID=UPI0036AAB559